MLAILKKGANHKKVFLVRIKGCNRLYEVGMRSNRRLERCGEFLTWCCTYCPSRSERMGKAKLGLLFKVNAASFIYLIGMKS